MKIRSMKTLLVASAASAAVLAGAGQASAQGAVETFINELNAMDSAQRAASARALRDAMNVPTTGRSGVSLEVSGQINRAFLYTHDGKRQAVQSTDNQNSSTRMRLIGTARLNEDISSRAYLEYEMQTLAGSAAGNTMAKGVSTTGNFNMRHADVQFISQTMGSIELGHGSNAADGAMWPDLSGTGVIALPSAVRLLGGGTVFRDKTAAPGGNDNRKIAPSGPNVGTALNQPTPASRSNRIAYRTPRLGGILQMAASHTNGDGYQLGARAQGNVDIVRFDVRGFYEKLPTAGTGVPVGGVIPGQNNFRHAYGGAASLLFNFGLSLMGSWSQMKRDGTVTQLSTGNQVSAKDPWGMYFKIGYQGDWTPMGRTALAIDFQQVKHRTGVNDDRGRAWGAMVVQNINALSAEVFLLWRLWQLDRKDYNAGQKAAGVADFRDIHQVAIGSRLRF